MAKDPIYRIKFLNQDEVYEIYARQIYQSDLWGFLEAEDFVFGSQTTVVVDPSEEKLKQQFEEVERSFIPVQSIIRIDVVPQGGVAKITEVKGSVTRFPMVPPRS
ncbi:DUF1820 family protein [Amphritea balenae]|uniref:DUF1820 family protein n=1 Tax=Amphritea balenae TaxID=452629 RepID=A0A3P1SN35_9GAMM|nr:DUF1820 family protein [Amphritea balenae]RRC98576.1 DUF1820 family protein [Amphritea balenae]GGK65645.1 hypothetical protein GCM10007941_14800 [Amphritea balenae]